MKAVPATSVRLRVQGSRTSLAASGLLGILVMTQHVPSGDAAPPVIQPTPLDAHSRHVFFETSSSAAAYHHSTTSVVAPSSLEAVDGRIPVETGEFRTAPNALRLTWTSASGGDWHASIKIATRFARRFEFSGDTLSMQVYSEEGLSPDESPRVFLQDSRGAGVPTIRLLAEHGPLAAKQWTELQFSLSEFASLYRNTAADRFALPDLATIEFVQGLDDGRPHTLLIDDVRVLPSEKTKAPPPPAPAKLSVQAHERHCDLQWTAGDADAILHYRIERAEGAGEFRPVAVRPGNADRAVDFLGEPEKSVQYRVIAVDVAGNESAASPVAQGTTRAYSDEELLDMVQEGCFRYYWEACNPDTGMAVEILPGDKNLVAVGASGFGVMAMLAATERQFVTRQESVERMLKIVRFLARADRFHGVWPHFLDGRTGRVNPYFGPYDNGGDLVETAFMIQGLLAARQYYDRDDDLEREIRDTITRLWREVEWDWYRQTPDSEVLYWHWSPDHGFHINHPLIGWNETLIIYLLAIASPTHGVPASMYDSGWAGQSDTAVEYRRGWSRTTQGDHYVNGNEYYGVKLDVGEGNGAELFFAQFSFLGFDPRGIRDKYANYFQNNRNIALISQRYSIDNPRKFVGYGADCWGRSAGINSGGGRALPRDDNGTICGSAALGLMPYVPEEAMAALKHFYRDLGSKSWGVYGFHDGFNETQQWFDEVYMGLNQAQIVIGLENHRSGLLWKLFMANSEIKPMLDAIGFVQDDRPIR